MNLIKPKKLKKGDTIAIIAPSGEVDMKKIKKAVSFFEKYGFKIRLGKNIDKCQNYLAGSDEERLEDLHNAFADKEIKAIICARGGYGAIRLINKIDYELIKNNPKIFCGYSDITALSAMILKKTGLIVSRREGKEIYYKLADTEVAEIVHRVCEEMFQITCPLD